MMGQSGAIHEDVASYALGVLDARDAARFEDHLAGCDACAIELESLLPVSALLSNVDGSSFVQVEESVRDGRMLDEMVNAVAYDRSRARARRMFSLAAGIIAVIVFSGLSIVLGVMASTGEDAPPVATGSPTPAGPDLGVGGLDELPGQRFSATDPTSKAKAEVVLEGHDWGTQVSIAVGGVTGPRVCQLVAVGDDGLGEVVYSWKVPPKGYGTKTNPQVLFLQGATQVDRKDIARVELQSLDAEGRSTLLVAVDV